MKLGVMKLYGRFFLLSYLTCCFRRIVAGYVQDFRHNTFRISKKVFGLPGFSGLGRGDPFVSPHLDTFASFARSQVSEVASFFPVGLFDQIPTR